MKLLIFTILFSLGISVANAQIDVDALLEGRKDVSNTETFTVTTQGETKELGVEVRLKELEDVKDFEKTLKELIQDVNSKESGYKFRLRVNFESGGHQFFEFDSEKVYTLDENLKVTNSQKLDNWLRRIPIFPSSLSDLKLSLLRLTINGSVMYVAAVLGGYPMESAFWAGLVQGLVSASFAFSPSSYMKYLLKQNFPHSKVASFNYLKMVPLEVFFKFYALELVFNVIPEIMLGNNGVLGHTGFFDSHMHVLWVAVVIAHAQLFLENALAYYKQIADYLALNHYLESVKERARLGKAISAYRKAFQGFNRGALIASAASVVAMGTTAVAAATGNEVIEMTQKITLAAMGAGGLLFTFLAKKKYNKILQLDIAVNNSKASYEIPLKEIEELERKLKTEKAGGLSKRIGDMMGPPSEEFQMKADFFSSLTRVLDQTRMVESAACSRSAR